MATRKAVGIEKDLSAMQKAMIRLKCLSAVVESGSRLDMQNPNAKAEEYYSFVVGRAPKKQVEKPTVSPVETLTDDNDSVLEIKQAPITSSPFENSGRKQVVI